jgi:Amt family ammonium transporter
MAALAIGAIAGVFCFLMCTLVKARFGYDDSLDAFGVHGAGGAIGALLTGVFASSVVNPIFKNSSGQVLASGALEGNRHQLVNQAIGVGIAAGLAVVGTLVILKVVDVVIGFKVLTLRSTAKKAIPGSIRRRRQRLCRWQSTAWRSILRLRA